MTLEQAVAPRVMPPGPLMRMVRGMCARTVGNMMEDLQKEIERRRIEGGRPGCKRCGAKPGYLVLPGGAGGGGATPC